MNPGAALGLALCFGVSAAAALSCSDFNEAAASADGGVGDGAKLDEAGNVVTGTPAGCDASAEPKDAPKCADDSFAVFVDATNGAEGNAGTKASPVKSIGGALGKLGVKSRVYICAGTYAEHVKLTTNASLYGGFACGAWSYTGDKAKIAPADAGYALDVGAASGTVADVELVAPPGSATSVSSVAVFVANSPQLTLRRVKVQAGAGLKGDDGADAVGGVSTPAAVDGTTGSASTGGPATSCTCSTGGTSKGAKGGDTSGPTPNGGIGETAQATPTPSTATGVGGTRSDCEMTIGGNGRVGSAAPPSGAAAAPSLGTLDATGWHPGDGVAGPNGIPGQGGGGGGSYTIGMPAQNGGGGGGACGGCGGGGGGGGKGGGASVAVVSVQSTVTVHASELVTANAGAGGAGKAGAGGAGGGVGGSKLTGTGACNGGNGGTGGAGGAGAGGAGGLSVGVLSKGPKPTLDTTTVTTGDKGAAGAGGAGNDGPDGQKAPSFEVQ